MKDKTNEILQKLQKEILELDYVQDFQKAEQRLREESDVFEQQSQMKALQKEAVLYQKIGKREAYRGTMREAAQIEKSLKNNLLVEDYQQKMQPVNALLEHITGEIEHQVNQNLQKAE